MSEKICEDCKKPFGESKDKRYKRKFPDKCPLCALINTPNKSYSNPIHGHRSGGKRDKLYVKWVQMRTSCNTVTSKDYKHVGGKGIKIYKSWNNYVVFQRWAKKQGYRDGMTFKRVDRFKDYGPDNCVFVKGRPNIVIRVAEQVHTIESLHKQLRGTVPLKTVYSRISKKWKPLDAMLSPVGLKIRNRPKVGVLK